ncbi:heme/steroid binding domain-containing protein [Blastomyces dermatitidis ER-3]|uniref:Heme/steroid binding domain-containing protein n=2 Tax=Ajellomyces dermatitidis TaxID=5039 RepID=F2TR48_AJEDA|nr:heme/steroid binding domain-containing protein [Blastomyces dermatitidis ER-3]EEQ89627.1 heme/steroid binding domain-containing protein [Blastomyces dermatitidis ER-3]EGE85711.1 heme/steroid binding domain-containing protein [Blastomyces dermatitidis ATCC 18188]EQL34770.1 hypothetical protein BDFG_03468 [Blastomyces dermatitidis ATCC 26199]
MSDLRQRPGKGPSRSTKDRTDTDESDELDYASTSSLGDEKTPSSSTSSKQTEQPRHSWAISPLDILRVIFLLFLTSSALSYYVTTDSVLWGYKLKILRWPVLKSYLRGPILLTPAQLALYNGTDPSLPIYIAINRTIFDVSANPRIYGKGGGYNTLAGVDATRAYVTGCFAEDRTPDLRGVELMYIPVEDDDGGAAERAMSAAAKKVRREREWREARESVRKQVEHWREFFANHEKYFEVGRVVGVEGLMGGPERELCEAARKSRPLRSQLNGGEG